MAQNAIKLSFSAFDRTHTVVVLHVSTLLAIVL